MHECNFILIFSLILVVFVIMTEVCHALHYLVTVSKIVCCTYIAILFCSYTLLLLFGLPIIIPKIISYIPHIQVVA